MTLWQIPFVVLLSPWEEVLQSALSPDHNDGPQSIKQISQCDPHQCTSIYIYIYVYGLTAIRIPYCFARTGLYNTFTGLYYNATGLYYIGTMLYYTATALYYALTGVYYIATEV